MHGLARLLGQQEERTFTLPLPGPRREIAADRYWRMRDAGQVHARAYLVACFASHGPAAYVRAAAVRDFAAKHGVRRSLRAVQDALRAARELGLMVSELRPPGYWPTRAKSRQMRGCAVRNWPGIDLPEAQAQAQIRKAATRNAWQIRGRKLRRAQRAARKALEAADWQDAREAAAELRGELPALLAQPPWPRP